MIWLRGAGPAVVVLVDSAVWAGWSLLVGFTASRVPAERLERDGWFTRPRAWERGGRAYARIGITRWKDRVPDAGAVFRGGTAKRSLVRRSDASLARFAAETRRAELVHWSVAAIAPLFVLWNPPRIFAVMVVYAVVANVPCVAIQRYNRARILRILERRAARRDHPRHGDLEPDG